MGYELKDGVFIGRVRDSGKGIAKDNLEKIFEQGFQVDDGKKGLAGLGLAIIKEVMSAHNGQVWAESPGEGQGTTVYFSLPLA